MDGTTVLVLTRKLDQKIVIGDGIVLTVLDIRNDSVRLGIDAPMGVKIQRSEVIAAVMAANISATHAGADSSEVIREQLGMILGSQPAVADAEGAAHEADGNSPQP
jgi:carbon storage regulator